MGCSHALFVNFGKLFYSICSKKKYLQQGKIPNEMLISHLLSLLFNPYFRRVSCLPFGKQFKKIYMWRVARFGTIHTISKT